MIVSGVVIALLILFLVGNAAGFFKGAGLSSKTEKMVTVPDVRGMTFENAQAELKKKDLGIKKADSDDFNGEYLHQKCAKKKTAIKPWLMDNKLVVGVGNIYASESLFAAGIHPDRLASSLSLAECELLARVIKAVLLRSIEQGGTTLKDFLQSDGKPGYFAQELQVYGRKGEPCRVCGTPIVATKHAQRATFYCRQCQK